MARVIVILTAASLALAAAQEPAPNTHQPIGIIEGHALGRLGVTPEDVKAARPESFDPLQRTSPEAVSKPLAGGRGRGAPPGAERPVP